MMKEQKMENDWPLKSHCGSVTQNKKKKRERKRYTHLRHGAMVTPQIPGSYHIYSSFSLFSLHPIVFFSLILFIAQFRIFHIFRRCMCVDCDGREIASSFLFMFRSMFYASRIVFAVFSYRLSASNFSIEYAKKEKNEKEKPLSRVCLLF